jgi:hypothetical protein
VKLYPQGFPFTPLCDDVAADRTEVEIGDVFMTIVLVLVRNTGCADDTVVIPALPNAFVGCCAWAEELRKAAQSKKRSRSVAKNVSRTIKLLFW